MNELLHSKLVFLTSLESTERLEVDRLRRVREPVSRSTSGIQGKVDVISGRSRHAESQNELRAFRVLLATGHPDAWQEQPFVLEYHHDGAKHRYTPDILVIWGTHKQVVEVKDDAEAERESAALCAHLFLRGIHPFTSTQKPVSLLLFHDSELKRRLCQIR